MEKQKKGHWFFALFLVVLLPIVSAANTSEFTWYTITSNYHELRLWATRCMNAPGDQDLNVTVYARPGSGTDENATVTGTVFKPLGGTDSLPFDTNFGDGNFGASYNFDQNGTYKLAIHSQDVNFRPGDLNEYIYVGDFDFNISFVNNGFLVAANTTGTVQNLVKNTDNNAVTGITGTLDIFYPSGSVFLNDGNISETGNGYYYYNFIAPNTNGLYPATSSFSCGTNTDSNNQGRFTVYGASGGDQQQGGGGGGGGGGVVVPRKEWDVRVKDYNFLKPLEVGQPSPLKLVLQNQGTQSGAFLVKVSVSQAEDVEYFFTQLSPFIKSKEETSMVLVNEFVPQYGGTHLLRIEIFKSDGSEQVGEFTKSFRVEGILRYDLSVSCLEKMVLTGKDASASLSLLNLGDYFQDIQLSWWAEDPQGKKMGEGVLPIALYRKETRNLVRSVTIPSKALLGQYTFKAQLRYQDLTVDGQCSFLVQNGEDYYRSQLAYHKQRLSELSRIIDLEEKNGRDVSDFRQKAQQVSSLLGELEQAINKKDFPKAEEANEEAKRLLSELSETLRMPPTFFLALSPRELQWALLLLVILVLVMALYFQYSKKKKLGKELLRERELPESERLSEKEEREKRQPRKETAILSEKDSLLDHLLGLKK